MGKLLHLLWLVSATILTALIVTLIAGCTQAPAATILYNKTGATPRTVSLWIIRPDGSGNQQIYNSGWYGEFSPDNSKIAFSEFYDNGIWVANANGTNPIQLTSYGSAPAWSPDGSKLAFHSGGAAGKSRYIWLMNADGSEAHRLSATNGSFPNWSPSGDKILFHGEVNNGIWQINPDGSGERLLYRNGGYPAWSPDGQEIAYVDLTDWGIWVMQADGTEQRKITSHTGLQPAWSPDGKQIAYDRSDRQNAGIWLINVDGSGDHQVSKGGSHPDWSN